MAPPLGELSSKARLRGAARSHGYRKTKANPYNPERTLYGFALDFIKLWVLTAPLSRCGGSSALHETAVRRQGRLHPLNLSGALWIGTLSLPPLGVVLRAANQDSNDCRWQSYLCFVPRSGKGGVVGIFELFPFNEPHPLSQAVRPASSPIGEPRMRRRGQPRYAEYHSECTKANPHRPTWLPHWGSCRAKRD